MPQERDNQYPVTTAQEVDAAPGDPATKAARNIMARRISGIPKRPFLLGQCDHAPVLMGVAEFTGAVQDLLAAAPPDYRNGTFGEHYERVLAMMNDHRCPSAPVVEDEAIL